MCWCGDLALVFERRRFLDLVKNFIVFGDTGSDVVKILAGYHQFHAVRHAVTCTLAATAPGGDRKAGVIWHTQGSGKSLLMAYRQSRKSRVWHR
jgi:type I restriction enzyme R subunit